MSNVIKLYGGRVTIKKLFCDCGHTLEYWLGNDECGYGLCPICDLDTPMEITLNEEKEWTH